MFSYPCCVDTCPCCWWSSAALLIFNKGSAVRKYVMPAKGLCSWHCMISKVLLKFSMCCGILTEHKKRWHSAARYSVLPFPRQSSQTCPDTSSTYSTLRHWKAMPLQVGMEEGQRLCVLAGCSIGSTVWWKLISLLLLSDLVVYAPPSESFVRAPLRKFGSMCT